MDRERPRHTISRRELLFNKGPKFFIGLGLIFTDSSIGKLSPRLRVTKPDTFSPVLAEAYLFVPDAVRGLCYGPYHRDSQNPDTGPHPSEDDIKTDIDIIGPIADYIRTYGAGNNLENIPRFILEKGSSVKVNAGCYLGPTQNEDQKRVNDQQIASLVYLANNCQNVVSVNVGNETQHFGAITEDQLVGYIEQVRKDIPQGITVTTGETWSEWTKRPRLVDAVDYIFAHIHPYWESVPIERAVDHIREKYELLQSLYPGKKIVIGETGWPSDGQARNGAIPSLANQKRFADEFLAWAKEQKVDFYLFEAFDEQWKTKYEGETGAHWGGFSSDGTGKYPLTLK